MKLKHHHCTPPQINNNFLVLSNNLSVFKYITLLFFFFLVWFVLTRVQTSPHLVVLSPMFLLVYRFFLPLFVNLHLFVEETRSFCPVVCPQLEFWILLVVSLWCHLTGPFVPCISCNLVVKSRVLRWFQFGILARLPHRWWCFLPYRGSQCPVVSFSDGRSHCDHGLFRSISSLGTAKWWYRNSLISSSFVSWNTS